MRRSGRLFLFRKDNAFSNLIPALTIFFNQRSDSLIPERICPAPGVSVLSLLHVLGYGLYFSITSPVLHPGVEVFPCLGERYHFFHAANMACSKDFGKSFIFSFQSLWNVFKGVYICPRNADGMGIPRRSAKKWECYTTRN